MLDAAFPLGQDLQLAVRAGGQLVVGAAGIIERDLQILGAAGHATPGPRPRTQGE